MHICGFPTIQGNSGFSATLDFRELASAGNRASNASRAEIFWTNCSFEWRHATINNSSLTILVRTWLVFPFFFGPAELRFDQTNSFRKRWISRNFGLPETCFCWKSDQWRRMLFHCLLRISGNAGFPETPDCRKLASAGNRTSDASRAEIV